MGEEEIFDYASALGFGHSSISRILVPGTEEMDGILNSKATFQRWLDVERALAEAEAEVGLIPGEAAREISRKAYLKYIDLKELENRLKSTKHPVVAMVWCLKKACNPPEYGEYVHWGATTQDILDTAMALQIKEATEIFLGRLKEIKKLLLNLAEKYKKSVMPARTHGQHAATTTFGFKVAVWLAETMRNMERLSECRRRVCVGNITGAVGTFSGMGSFGVKVQSLALKKLGLNEPLICGHSSRDGVAEYSYVLSLIGSTIGKIANEIYNLQRTEIGELEEKVSSGAVGSSTMPHKRNPHVCESIVNDAALARRVAAFMNDGMIVEHGREMMSWGSQFTGIPLLLELVDSILVNFKNVIEGLNVNVKKMEENFWIRGGLIFSEAVMFTLARRVGRQTAHEIVYRCAMRAFKERRSLKDVLLKDEEASKHLSGSEIDAAMNPGKSVDQIVPLVNRVIKRFEETKS